MATVVDEQVSPSPRGVAVPILSGAALAPPPWSAPRRIGNPRCRSGHRDCGMTDQEMPSKDCASHAPVLPFDWVWEDGETIWPCAHCAPWHVDLYQSPDFGALMVREWHAVGCSIWADVGSF